VPTYKSEFSLKHWSSFGQTPSVTDIHCCNQTRVAKVRVHCHNHLALTNTFLLTIHSTMDPSLSCPGRQDYLSDRGGFPLPSSSVYYWSSGKVQEKKSILDTVQHCKFRWIGHILRHDSHLYDTVEGRMKGKAARGRKQLQMLNNVISKSYEDLKREVEDRSWWKAENWRERYL